MLVDTRGLSRKRMITQVKPCNCVLPCLLINLGSYSTMAIGPIQCTVDACVSPWAAQSIHNDDEPELTQDSWVIVAGARGGGREGYGTAEVEALEVLDTNAKLCLTISLNLSFFTLCGNHRADTYDLLAMSVSDSSQLDATPTCFHDNLS